LPAKNDPDKNPFWCDAMRAIFIADAHLKSPLDGGYQKCMHFFDGLHGKAAGAQKKKLAETNVKSNEIDMLVIAGDFFDFWFERRGRVYPEFEPVVKNIARLRNEGVRICICGIEVYPDEMELLLDGLRIYVSHGDTVDRENRRYLALRRFLRSAFVYRLQKAAPLSLLFSIARASSGISREMAAADQTKLVNTMGLFAGEKFDEGFDAIILGHSHAELLNKTRKNGQQRIFATLGDWITRYTYLEYEQGVFSLKRFSGW
jgi:UDP-2,3-diacylglucosamine hydrolase